VFIVICEGVARDSSLRFATFRMTGSRFKVSKVKVDFANKVVLSRRFSL